MLLQINVLPGEGTGFAETYAGVIGDLNRKNDRLVLGILKVVDDLMILSVANGVGSVHLVFFEQFIVVKLCAKRNVLHRVKRDELFREDSKLECSSKYRCVGIHASCGERFRVFVPFTEKIKEFLQMLGFDRSQFALANGVLLYSTNHSLV